jgi:gluconate:H+ symporter, GntP family
MTGIGLLLIIALSIGIIIYTCSILKWHPFISLFVASLFTGIVAGIPLSELTKAMADGFGNMMAHIGIVVILGTLIGTILEKTGATNVIADAILKLVGRDKPVLAITMIGFIVGIPIFCDSGYVILSGLTKPLARESGKPYPSIVAGLSSGLYITHTMLPPHPGSLAGAGNLGLGTHLGVVIMIGLIVSLPVAVVAYLWAKKIVSTFTINDQRPNEESIPDATAIAHTRPSLIKSILPIIIPVLLIALGSMSSIIEMNKDLSYYLNFIGSPIIALSIGLLTSTLLIGSAYKGQSEKWFKEGIGHAGPILILVGAGGIYGAVLKKTSLATWIGTIIDGSLSPTMFLLVAYLLGVLLKTAQGSTTSGIIVVSSILAPIAPGLGFDSPTELIVLLLALSSGCMMVSHANDAYFWVISQFSGLSMSATNKVFSLTTVVLSISTFACTLLAYFILVE